MLTQKQRHDLDTLADTLLCYSESRVYNQALWALYQRWKAGEAITGHLQLQGEIDGKPKYDGTRSQIALVPEYADLLRELSRKTKLDMSTLLREGLYCLMPLIPVARASRSAMGIPEDLHLFRPPKQIRRSKKKK